ncbi:MAG: DUF882 domain-containing protein [Xanthobacteraceae bacterium]
MGSFLLSGLARQLKSLSLPKAGYHLGLSSLLLMMGAGSVHDAAALNETRTLSFHHTHSGEDLTVTFKRDGRYDEAALKELNHFLRDWRSQDQTVMDRHLFDILWEVYRDVDGKKPIQIISAYRSPATNAMLRRRSSGVARFSQHMLGHAMDMYIPDVPLEQIRFAGLRLQRGGVGFYPTSGSPFVHLDVGSIRHWPRMTHDQLARVFPDGRTVHVPADGVPLKGYELARAEIEKRDNGDAALTKTQPNVFAALFKGKSSSDDEDEGAGAAVEEKPAPPNPTAVAAKSTDAVPVPRAKPQIAAAFQLASADAQMVQTAKETAKETARPKQPAQTAEAKPQTPADIINARGFWDDAATTPKQATPAQVAAISARKALAAADPQPTASVSALQALAYAPAASSPVDRANVVAASAPIPRSSRPSASRNAAPATGIDTVVAKGPQGPGNVIAISTRLAAAAGNNIWMRVMMLAPSASSSMNATVLGDADMTVMRVYFVKPQAAIAMTFSGDPQMGMVTDHFSGSATAKLTTQSFVMQTASLR